LYKSNLEGATATYSPLDDRVIEILNESFENKLNVRLSRAAVKVKLPNKLESGKIKVSFLWIFYAYYTVLELDQVSYQYSMIGR